MQFHITKHYLASWLLILTVLSGCSTTYDKGEDLTEKSNAMNEQTQLAETSAETMRVASEFMAAMGSGDMDKLNALMDDQMIWHNEGDKSMPWIGPWNGKKAILEEFMPLFGANFQTVKWETEDGFASGNTAAFFGKMIGRLTSTGEETNEFTFALRVKVKDGKIILWNWLEDSYDVSKKYHGQ